MLIFTRSLLSSMCTKADYGWCHIWELIFLRNRWILSGLNSGDVFIMRGAGVLMKGVPVVGKTGLERE